MSNWKPPSKKFESHSSIRTLQDITHFNVDPYWRSRDWKSHKSENNFFTGCVYWHTDEERDEWKLEKENERWHELDTESIIKKYAYRHGDTFRREQSSVTDGSYWPCSIIEQNDEAGDKYTVRVFQSKMHADTLWEEMKLPLILVNYPKESIQYFHHEYSSDQFLPGAFRHYIEIDDEMFPPHWKNIHKA